MEVKMEKIDYSEEFKKLLKELGKREISEETKERAKKIFKTIDAKTLATIEQEIIKEGVSHEEYGITEPVEIMKLDHIEYRERKKKLYDIIATNNKKYSFEEFKKNVIEIGEYLVRELQSHIFKEDNILYQIALQTLNEKDWEEVKKECDKIGYCCFTPSDRLEEGK
jgi:DUF438 domain-containing protein